MAFDRRTVGDVGTSAPSKRYLEEAGSGAFEAVCELPSIDRVIACALRHGAPDFATVDRQLAVSARTAKLRVHTF